MSKPRDRLGVMPQGALAIHRIRVEKLFGRYTYDLQAQASAKQPRKLLILYGDNGSGKTTLLQLVFNLLSHIDKHGHKSFLAKTKFKALVIDLGDRTQVIARRRGNRIVGTYTAYVRRHGRIVARIKFLTDKDNDIVSPPPGRQHDLFERRAQHLLTTLANLRIALFFVTDDRQLLQNVTRQKDVDTESELGEEEAHVRRIVRRSPRSRRRYLDTAVSRAITVAAEWAREQVFTGSRKGEADANTIYTGIVRQLARVSAPRSESKRTNIARLITTLREQAARTAQFVKFGFPSALNINELIGSLVRAKKDLSTIQRIVEPFVDTIKAKLDALQEVQDSVSGFVDTLNSFFKDKTVEFNLKSGISIKASDNTSLPPSSLSSGEKQLLLLFCNTLITRSDQAIYLIDEPEISLNIKWQRQLIQSLFNMSAKRKVQFVLATHSFELFAPFQENVLHLIERKDATKRASTAHA